MGGSSTGAWSIAGWKINGPVYTNVHHPNGEWSWSNHRDEAVLNVDTPIDHVFEIDLIQEVSKAKRTPCETGDVHGAGLDVWVWEELVLRMQAPTLSAEFPARETDQTVRDDLRLADYTDAVTEQVEELDTPRVILVAHSIGGAVCMEVASRIPDHLTGFVGLSAGIPEPGQSFLLCFPFHQRVVQQAILRFAGTRPPERIIRGSLCA